MNRFVLLWDSKPEMILNFIVFKFWHIFFLGQRTSSSGPGESGLVGGRFGQRQPRGAVTLACTGI